MIFKIIKKSRLFITTLFLFIITLFCLTSCVNDKYQKRMLEYYSEDSNFVELVGIVKGKSQDNILQIEVLSSSAEFYMYDIAIGDFMLYSNVEILENIEVDDSIVFISAPRQFYDGHKWPIVSLSKDDENLLAFEEGKKNYIDWIKDNFS